MKSGLTPREFASVPGAYPTSYEDLAPLPDGGVVGYASKTLFYTPRGRVRKQLRLGGGYSVQASDTHVFIFGVRRVGETTCQAITKLTMEGSEVAHKVVDRRFSYGTIALSADGSALAGIVAPGGWEKATGFTISASLGRLRERSFKAIHATGWVGSRAVFATSEGLVGTSAVNTKLRTKVSSRLRATALAGPRDRRWIACACSSEIVVLDPKLKVIARTKAPRGIDRLWVEPTGRVLMAAVRSGLGKGLYVLNLESLESCKLPAPVKIKTDNFVVGSGCFSRDGQTFFFGQDSVMSRVDTSAAPTATKTRARATKGVTALLEHASEPDPLVFLKTPRKKIAVPKDFGVAPQVLERWLSYGPQLDPAFTSWKRPTAFAKLVGKELRPTLGWLLANAFPVTSSSDPVLVHVGRDSCELLIAFHDEHGVHAVSQLADSLSAGTVLLALGRQHEEGHELDPEPALRTLAGHVHCVGRFDVIDEMMSEFKIKRPRWTSSGLAQFRRASWIMELLEDEDEIDFDIAAELYDAYAEDFETLQTARRRRHFWDRPGDALYWLLHAFFCNEAAALKSIQRACLKSASPIVRSAAKFIGSIDDTSELVAQRDAFIAMD